MTLAKRHLPILALSISLALAGVADAASTPPSGRITLNFVDADIGSVIKAMSEMTGRAFVVDPRVKGTLNITTPKPVASSTAYDIFLATLRMQGYAAVQVGGVVRIIPEADAKFYAVPTPGKTSRSRVGGEMVTRVFPLKHESAIQLQTALRPLVGVNSNISAEQGSNTLLVTDYADNLARLEHVINSLDVPSADEPVLIPLKYASAQEVATLIGRVFTLNPGQGTTGAIHDIVQVSVDERSNSLIVRSRDRSMVTKVQNLVASLDTPTPAAGNVHVIYLKNAQAVEIAKTLRNIVSADNSALAPATTPAQNGGKSTTSQDSGPGMIQADAASNALIITAPEAIFNNLKAVVEKLDVRRAQVLVEALIAEVTADKAAEFGIQWMRLGNNGIVGGFGNTGRNNIGAVAANPLLATQGFNVGVVNGTVSLGPESVVLDQFGNAITTAAASIYNLGMLATALQSDADANILSTPTLLTLDNEEAKISVGSNVPFLTGQYAITGGTASANPFQTVERKDVGLILKIKPQISEGGTVRLAISQEVSKLRSSDNPTLAATDKRSIESTVLVDDGQIVVLGGLIEDQVRDSEDKVPLLGDIPILGHLFRYTNRQHIKTNLMVFLRPVIVRDATGAAAVTHPRYDYILGQQKAAAPAHKPLLPDVPNPLISNHLQPGNGTPTQVTPPLEQKNKAVNPVQGKTEEKAWWMPKKGGASTSSQDPALTTQ